MMIPPILPHREYRARLVMNDGFRDTQPQEATYPALSPMSDYDQVRAHACRCICNGGRRGAGDHLTHDWRRLVLW
jgi:hypothetical protein